MERYFSKVVNASNSRGESRKPRYHPYKPQSLSPRSELPDTIIERSKSKFTARELNRVLLNSLSSEHNPITHSDARERADRAVSTSTGHQVNEERVNRKSYFEDRERKLSAQQNSSSNSNGVLRSVRVYLSGYLSGTTDIELKRIVIEAGGQTVMTPTQCTHIVTSQWLSGSKTHRLLTTKMRTQPYVVRPEWIFDSVAKGKRQPERGYAISIDNTHKADMCTRWKHM